jgi:hypothetical protein
MTGATLYISTTNSPTHSQNALCNVTYPTRRYASDFDQMSAEANAATAKDDAVNDPTVIFQHSQQSKSFADVKLNYPLSFSQVSLLQVKSYPILSYDILCYPVLSCAILCYAILSYAMI